MPRKPVPKIILTHSEMAAFKDCRQKHEFAYGLGWKPQLVGPSTIFGAGTHRAQEVRALGYPGEESTKKIRAIFDQYIDRNRRRLNSYKIQKYLEAKDRCIAVFKDYERFYGPQDKDWLKPAAIDGRLAVEIEGLVPIYTPSGRASRFYTFAFKLDMLVYIDGEWWIVDHKTRADIVEEATAKLIMDQQMRWYAWAAQVYFGIKIAGVIYNIIRSRAESSVKINKNGQIAKAAVDCRFETLENAIDYQDNYLRSLTKERAKELKIKKLCINVYEYEDLLKSTLDKKFFLRHFQRYSEDDMRHAQGEIYQTSMWMHNCQFIDRNNSACEHWGGCPYRSVCMGMDTEGKFDVREKHTELILKDIHPAKGKGYILASREPMKIGVDGMLDAVNI